MDLPLSFLLIIRACELLSYKSRSHVKFKLHFCYSKNHRRCHSLFDPPAKQPKAIAIYKYTMPFHHKPFINVRPSALLYQNFHRQQGWLTEPTVAHSTMTSQEEQKTTSQASKPEIKQRQANVDSFWANFYTKHPGTVYNVLPTNSLAKKDTAQAIKSKGNGKRAVATYEEATLACKKAVDKIVMDCRRVNQKYRDPDFDIEFDLKIGKGDCLHGLDTDSHYTPLSTKSVSVGYLHPCALWF